MPAARKGEAGSCGHAEHNGIELALDKVCCLIDKAKEFDVQAGVVEEDYGLNPIDENIREVLKAFADDTT